MAESGLAEHALRRISKLVATIESLIAFAADVRADRAANPQVAGDGTALELLIAPRFQALVEAVLPHITVAPPRVLPEYRLGGFGRPDLAFAQPGALARAFIELKEPRKEIEPGALRGHDADQFARFSELPVWALTNFISIRLFERGRLMDQAAVVPRAAIDPATSAAEAERLIGVHDPSGFERILQTLAMSQLRAPRDPQEIAEVLAHAARLVRSVVLAQCRAGLGPVASDVRAEFNETLFARAEAGGYDPRDMDTLFSSAFAQTLVFGLLLAREAGGVEEVRHDAYTLLPDATYPLLRGTLRALTLDEVRAMLGAAFDVTS